MRTLEIIPYTAFMRNDGDALYHVRSDREGLPGFSQLGKDSRKERHQEAEDG